MGIIEKQATQNAINYYAGALLGFLTILWMPRLLNPEENGLIRILLSFSILFAQFSNLGFSAVVIRLFPYFKNKENAHNGFLYYAITIPLLGFIAACVFFFIFRENIVENNIEKSKLFVDYLYYIIPLAFFTLFFNVLDVYLRAGYSSVIGVSVKEVIQRLLILVVLVLYFLKIISFHAFVFLYTLAISASTLILAAHIIINNEWSFKPNRKILTPELRSQAIKLSFYTVLAELSAGIIVTVDSIMLNHLLGLGKTGIYGIAFNFGNLMTVPSRSISRIGTSIVIENFKKNDMKEIASLYKKSCNTQLAIGALLFIGVIVNINNIMALLPPDYQSGKYIIVILCIGNFIEMATGLNHTIVAFSKYYNYDSYFTVALVFVAFLCNYWFIQSYGMIGAAMAMASLSLIGNATRSLFVYFVYKMQPYDKNTAKLIAISVIACIAGYFIPNLSNLLYNIALRSSVTAAIFGLLILKTEASPEINAKIRKILRKISVNI